MYTGQGSVDVTGGSESPDFVHANIGRDYTFADVTGPNLAQRPSSLTRQSTTAYGGVASRATDGRMDGSFSTGSLTLTTQHNTPWWQVRIASE